jgi:hypothetical protein
MSALVPTYEHCLEGAAALAQLRIRTVIPGLMTAYEATTNTAVVQPGPHAITATGEFIPMPPVEAPVVFPVGGGFAITWPLLPGNRVLLLCADRDLTRWKQTGAVYKPASLRKHSVSDALVLPLDGPMPDPVTGSSATDLVIVGPAGVMLRITPAGTMVLAEGVTQAAVARVGDAVGPSELMVTWMSQVAGFLNGSAPGTVSPAAPGTFGTITEGSERVQAG